MTESERRIPPPVETKGLSKRYGSTTAVQNLDFSVRRGEVYGFLGPNGAGKTTTLRMLLGLIRPSSGEASVMGEAPGSPAGTRRGRRAGGVPGLLPLPLRPRQPARGPR